MESKGTGDLTLLEPVGNNLVTTSLTSVFWDSLPSPSSHLPLTSWYWESSLWGILTIYRSGQISRCHLTSAINYWWLYPWPFTPTRPTYSDSSFSPLRSPQSSFSASATASLEGSGPISCFSHTTLELGSHVVGLTTAASFKRSFKCVQSSLPQTALGSKSSSLTALDLSWIFLEVFWIWGGHI